MIIPYMVILFLSSHSHNLHVGVHVFFCPKGSSDPNFFQHYQHCFINNTVDLHFSCFTSPSFVSSLALLFITSQEDSSSPYYLGCLPFLVKLEKWTPMAQEVPHPYSARDHDLPSLSIPMPLMTVPVPIRHGDHRLSVESGGPSSG